MALCTCAGTTRWRCIRGRYWYTMVLWLWFNPCRDQSPIRAGIEILPSACADSSWRRWTRWMDRSHPRCREVGDFETKGLKGMYFETVESKRFQRTQGQPDAFNLHRPLPRWRRPAARFPHPGLPRCRGVQAQKHQVQIESNSLFIRFIILKPGCFQAVGSSLHLRPPRSPPQG